MTINRGGVHVLQKVLWHPIFFLNHKMATLPITTRCSDHKWTSHKQQKYPNTTCQSECCRDITSTDERERVFMLAHTHPPISKQNPPTRTNKCPLSRTHTKLKYIDTQGEREIERQRSDDIFPRMLPFFPLRWNDKDKSPWQDNCNFSKQGAFKLCFSLSRKLSLEPLVAVSFKEWLPCSGIAKRLIVAEACYGMFLWL